MTDSQDQLIYRLRSEKEEIEKQFLLAQRELEAQKANNLLLSKQLSTCTAQVNMWTDAYEELKAKYTRNTLTLSRVINRIVDDSKLLIESKLPIDVARELTTAIEAMRPMQIR